MTDSNRRPPSTSRLSPEEITNRGFASAFRGVSETEVRNFLRRIADDLSAMRVRESELTRQIEDLKDQIANPPPVTEQQLLDSLGEETARVLRSAQDAAEDMRKRAEERSATLVQEAKETATHLREEAEQQAATRTELAERRALELEQEAETRTTQLREEAEREATELRERTAREAEALREQAERDVAADAESAKATSQSLVEEARTVRERVLSDLARRRSLLQAQVDELRSGRDRLLDAYRVVKHTLSDATVALAQVETRANAELAAPAPRVSVPPVEGELEMLASASADATAGEGGGAGIDIDLEAESVAETDSAPPAGEGDQPTPGAEDSGAAVDALFARLRASHTADPTPGLTIPPAARGPAPGVSASPISSGTDPAGSRPADRPNGEGAAGAEAKPAGAESEPPPDAGASDPKQSSQKKKDRKEADRKEADRKEAAAKATAAKAPSGKAQPKAETTVDPDPPVEAESREASAPRPLTGDDALRAERDELLGPITHDLVRRAKRALQDQQNEILDKIRTVKGKADSNSVLVDEATQTAAWVAVLEEPLAAAYTHSYRETAGKGQPGPELPTELAEELARAMVEPWRRRLVAAIDGAGDDSEAITQRLGARYREYRGKDLDRALGDALAAAWARGTWDAVPDGTKLRWVPAEVGRCPDCDDNALEPTARSDPFPTGQLLPPAHPGCRCFLVLAEPDRRRT